MKPNPVFLLVAAITGTTIFAAALTAAHALGRRRERRAWLIGNNTTGGSQ